MVQILTGAEGSPALIMHSHTPSYRSGASNKTETGNGLLIIVNGLLTIASSARRKEWDLPSCCQQYGHRGAERRKIGQYPLLAFRPGQFPSRRPDADPPNDRVA
jgi:hypothetical protein